jgi:hypothetical protein
MKNGLKHLPSFCGTIDPLLVVPDFGNVILLSSMVSSQSLNISIYFIWTPPFKTSRAKQSIVEGQIKWKSLHQQLFYPVSPQLNSILQLEQFDFIPSIVKIVFVDFFGTKINKIFNFSYFSLIIQIIWILPTDYSYFNFSHRNSEKKTEIATKPIT